MAEYTFAARRYVDGRHTGVGPWLDLVRAANGISAGFFGGPTFRNQDEGGKAGEYVEVYPHAEIDLSYQNHATVVREVDDGTVTVRSTDEYGAEILRQAHATLERQVP